MRNLLLFMLLFIAAAVHAQTIPNAEFENWNSVSFDEPNTWFTSNSYSVPQNNLTAVTKVTGAVGANAVRIANAANTTDTIGGYIANSDGDIMAGEGGVPCTLKTTSFKGQARYNIVTGDTALIFIVFKKNGTPIGNKIIKITGSQSSFTAFSYSVSMPITPDSVIVAAAASNLMTGDPVLGSWIELDSLHFTDASSGTAFLNSGFENWTTTSNNELADWNAMQSGTVLKTTDKYSGTYAVRLLSLDDGTGSVDAASIGQTITLNKRIDTLVGYYKYTVKTPDTGMAMLVLFDSVGSYITQLNYSFTPQANYTYFKIPLVSTPGAASAMIQFYSHGFMSGPAKDSSSLYLDKLEIKPQSTTSVGKLNNITGNFTLYPNPAMDVLMIKPAASVKGAMDVVVYDLKGGVVYRNKFEAGKGTLSVPVLTLANGMYICEIVTEGGVAHNRFVKQ